MKLKIGVLLLAIPLNLGAANIRPLNISKVQLVTGGQANVEYFAVLTVIQRNPDGEGAPIISRSVLGSGPLSNANPVVPANVELKVPQKLTDLQAESGVNIKLMSSMISQAVGKVGSQIPDAKVQAAAAAAGLAVDTLGVIADQGTKIAGKIIDKVFDKQTSTITLIELLPKGYYSIDTNSGQVKMTEKYADDLKRFYELQQSYADAMQALKNSAEEYNRVWDQFQLDFPYDPDKNVSPSLYQDFDTRLNALWATYDRLKPLAEDKLKIEAQLMNYPLQRMAIMAFNLPTLGTCAGAGSGPQVLRMFVYLGANQINSYDIKYCVPNPSARLTSNIVIQTPQIVQSGQKAGEYQEGGIKFVCNDVTVKYQGLTAAGDLTFAYDSSALVNLYDTMVTSEKGVSQFLLPFDMYDLQVQLQEASQEAAAKKDAATKQYLDQALDTFQGAMSKVKSEPKEPAGQKVTAASLKSAIESAYMQSFGHVANLLTEPGVNTATWDHAVQNVLTFIITAKADELKVHLEAVRQATSALLDVLSTNYDENYAIAYDKAKMTAYINAEAQKLITQLNATKANIAKVSYLVPAKKDARDVTTLLADKLLAAVRKAQADLAKVMEPKSGTAEWLTLKKQALSAYKVMDNRNIVATAGRLKDSEINLMRDANVSLVTYLNKSPLDVVMTIAQNLSKLFNTAHDTLKKVIEAVDADRDLSEIDTQIVDPFATHYQSELNTIEQNMAATAMQTWGAKNSSGYDALEILKGKVGMFCKAIKDDFDDFVWRNQ